MAGAPYSLQGKTVLITGAARGIGAEAARRVAQRGARVSLVGLEPEELASVARECGGGALHFEADVADPSSLQAAVDATVERADGIDVVVANAGIAGGGPMTHMDEDTFRRVIEVNVIGTWRTLRMCLPHVIERRGYLLPIASLAAIVPQFPGFVPYSTSKAAVEAMAKNVRVEVAHLGVDVGVAYFGWIDTDLVRGGDEHPAFAFARSRMRGPFAKTLPVGTAADAIVRGIESRSAVVAEPPFLRVLLPLRGLLTRAIEGEVKRSVPEVMARFEAEYQQTGDPMAKPVGPGGAAALRAEAERAAARQ